MHSIYSITLAFCLFLLVLPTHIQAEEGGQALRPGSGQVLTKEKVEAALRHYALKRGPWQPEQVEVRVPSFTPLPLPAGQVNLRILRPLKGVTPGPHSFFLAVEVEGEEKTRMWVRAEIRVFGQVVVTSRPFAHYEAIVPEDVRLERRELSFLSTRAFTRIEEVAGQQASRAIAVNEILTPSVVEPPQVMRRGSTITLVYQTSGLKVEARGQAEEGGKVGDIIRVKNFSSGKVLAGQILDARTVQVNW
jgi:flagella basal body P-ring formation protein FlgA